MHSCPYGHVRPGSTASRRRSGRGRATGEPVGAVRPGSVGPKNATTGVPTAAARCIGPESFVTTTPGAARGPPRARPGPGRRRGPRGALRAAAATRAAELALGRVRSATAQRNPPVRQRVGERGEALGRPALGRRDGAARAERGEPAPRRARPPRAPPRAPPPRRVGKGKARRLVVGRDPVRPEKRVVVAQLVARRRRRRQRVGQERAAPSRWRSRCAGALPRRTRSARREASWGAATPRRTRRDGPSSDVGQEGGVARGPRRRCLRPVDRRRPAPAPARARPSSRMRRRRSARRKGSDITASPIQFGRDHEFARSRARDFRRPRPPPVVHPEPRGRILRTAASVTSM